MTSEEKKKMQRGILDKARKIVDNKRKEIAEEMGVAKDDV
jgi:hypothetical protein